MRDRFVRSAVRTLSFVLLLSLGACGGGGAGSSGGGGPPLPPPPPPPPATPLIQDLKNQPPSVGDLAILLTAWLAVALSLHNPSSRELAALMDQPREGVELSGLSRMIRLCAWRGMEPIACGVFHCVWK